MTGTIFTIIFILAAIAVIAGGIVIFCMTYLAFHVIADIFRMITGKNR